MRKAIEVKERDYEKQKRKLDASFEALSNAVKLRVTHAKGKRKVRKLRDYMPSSDSNDEMQKALKENAKCNTARDKNGNDEKELRQALEESKKSHDEREKLSEEEERMYRKAVRKSLAMKDGKGRGKDSDGEQEGSTSQASREKWIQKLDETPPAYCPHPVNRRLGTELNREVVSCGRFSLFFLVCSRLILFLPPPPPPISYSMSAGVISIVFEKAFLLSHSKNMCDKVSLPSIDAADYEKASLLSATGLFVHIA